MKSQSATSIRQAAISRWATLFVLAFFLRLLAIHFLVGTLDGDSNGYLNLGRNLLREHVYSMQEAAPFYSSFARVPGYPLFLALINAGSRTESLGAIRIAQALLDTMTCLGVAMLAGLWEFDAKRKRAASLAAFLLAALCPFTIRYVPTILSETLSTFLVVALALAASRALLAQATGRALRWWAFIGLLGGAGTLVRPDGLLFFLAALGALIAGAIWLAWGKNRDLLQMMPSLARAWLCFAIAVLAFTFAFAPWPVRNAIVFHQFMPLQPRHQGVPNGFVPTGYYNWLRTWVDDQRYIQPFRWEVDYSPIALEQLPAKAFDSPEERARVDQLLERYNHPDLDPTDAEMKRAAARDKPQSVAAGVRMTAEIDSGFAQIASERRQRNRWRFYLWLPVKRAVALWFDTHSDHYPFAGELFPLPDASYFKAGNHSYLGYAILWLFAALVWLYTLLGLSGAARLWRASQPAARIFVLFALFLMLPRLAFFATLDNPEPRFLVQFFPLLAALAGVALAHQALRSHALRGNWHALLSLIKRTQGQPAEEIDAEYSARTHISISLSQGISQESARCLHLAEQHRLRERLSARADRRIRRGRTSEVRHDAGDNASTDSHGNG
jgi:hypothetical protein